MTSSTALIQGTWTISNWSQAVVTINKLPLQNATSIQVTKEMSVASGTCNITSSDPNMQSYDIFGGQDEVEVFMSSLIAPPVGRKVWGGYLDAPKFDQNKGQTFTLTGKEYLSKLQSYTYSGAFTASDIADAARTILGGQSDFSFEGIPAVLGSQTTTEFTNETYFNAIKAVMDAYQAYFWIDSTTRDFAARNSTDVVMTPDQVAQGANFLRESNVQQNSEYLTNQLTINYGGPTPSSITVKDQDSINRNGLYARQLTTGDVTSAAAATTLGNNIIAVNKDPIQIYTLESQFLPYTDPGEYIYVNVPSLGLNGNYQVRKLEHDWSPSTGIRTGITVNTLNVDTRLYIANLERRLQKIEAAVYS